MANVQKYTSGACGHLFKHFDRAKDENGEYIRFKNQSIDAEKTPLNYNLAPEHDSMEFLHQRLSEVKVLKRKDVNVMCSWVITIPATVPREKQREFFEMYYGVLKNRYGEKNIISANVHMDEVSPHMHFAFIPVVEDKKKGFEKCAAKECITKSDLQSFHTDMQKEVDRWINKSGYDFECAILNGATANGNKTIEELKAKTLERENRKLKEKELALKERNNLLKEKNDSLKFKSQELDKTLIKAQSTLEKYEPEFKEKLFSHEKKAKVIFSEEDWDKIQKAYATSKGARIGYIKATKVLESKFCELDNKIDNLHSREIEIIKKETVIDQRLSQINKTRFSVNADKVKLQEEKENVEEIKGKYKQLYNSQKELNHSYNKLHGEHNSLISKYNKAKGEVEQTVKGASDAIKQSTDKICGCIDEMGRLGNTEVDPNVKANLSVYSQTLQISLDLSLKSLKDIDALINQKTPYKPNKDVTVAQIKADVFKIAERDGAEVDQFIQFDKIYYYKHNDKWGLWGSKKESPNGEPYFCGTKKELDFVIEKYAKNGVKSIIDQNEYLEKELSKYKGFVSKGLDR